MTRATITQQGQIIIPQEIQNYLKLSEGSQVEFIIDANGDIKMGVAESRYEIRRGNPLWLPFISVRVGTRPTPTVKNHASIQQRLKMIPLTIPVERLSGILHRSKMAVATLEDMEAAIVQGARSMNVEKTHDWT
ncbi:AbrB/MazE/SpoVT family DNA-binding domain-containing protein [Leptolyngbyaceae cyanobacterium UHCC 1019]